MSNGDGGAQESFMSWKKGYLADQNRISLYLPATKFAVMDERLLDVIIGLAAFLILVVLLAVLPLAMAPMTGYAYIVAIIIFILFLSGAGYLVNGKIT